MKPLAHKEIKNKLKEFNSNRKNVDIIFLLQSIDSGINVGHIFRIADAISAKEIVLSGRTPVPDKDKDIQITSMGNELRIPFKHFDQFEAAIDYVKSLDYQIVSLELTENSTQYNQINYSNKVCIVLGNETDGVYPYVLKHSDHIVHIPMYGKNYSLNVHVAGAILAYYILLS